MEDLPDIFVTEKAPRTGICAAKNGTLILTQVSISNEPPNKIFAQKVDGEEDIQTGLDLHEFSEVLRDLGCWEGVVRLVRH